jgi:hypothetical protein
MHSAYCSACIYSDVKINAVAGFTDISVFFAVAGVLVIAGVLAVASCRFVLSLASLFLLLHNYIPAITGVPDVISYLLLLAPLLWLSSLHGKHPCYCWCNFR